MDLFETVKDSVPVREAAEHYGIEVGKNGMACCPFHDDNDPSLKIYEDHFHCFGCGEHGDVVDLVGKMFGLSPGRAAEKLASDFGIRSDGLSAQKEIKRPSVISKLEAAKRSKEKENRCSNALCGYLRLLADWRERYAPKPTDEEWHPLFAEALQKTDYIEYLLVGLISGPVEERAAIVNEVEKGIDRLEQRVGEFSGAGPDGRQKPETQKSADAVKPRKPRCADEMAI